MWGTRRTLKRSSPRHARPPKSRYRRLEVQTARTKESNPGSEAEALPYCGRKEKEYKAEMVSSSRAYSTTGVGRADVMRQSGKCARRHLQTLDCEVQPRENGS